MNARLPPPELQELFWSHWKTAALRAAIELQVFEGISEGLADAASLAGARGADMRGMSRLLDALCGMGLLGKDGNSYRLTRLSDPYLVEGGPEYFGARIGALASPLLWEAWGRLPEVVRSGRPPSEENASHGDFSHWRNLARALAPTARLGGEALWDLLGIDPGTPAGRKVLDLGCGSGIYSFCLLERDPEARATLADWPQVLEVAGEIASEMGVASRTSPLPGDIMGSELPEGAFDLALISNVIHGMGPSNAGALLRRAYSALKPGGTVIINEYLADEERASETFSLLFSLHMLLISPEGDAYTLPELREWLETAGFREVTYRGRAGLGQVVTGSK